MGSMNQENDLKNVILLLGLVLLAIVGGVCEGVFAADELNCVLCHKYRGLSRVDKEGNFRLFYINEKMFKKSPHSRLKCIDCHSDIDEIPHKPAEKVDCTKECHLEEPSSSEKFSHKPVSEILARSVHSKYDENGNLKEMAGKYPEDYPHCKDCHDNPLYRPLSFFKGEAAGISRRGLSRCKTCHTKGEFAETFYAHVTSRLQKMRSPKEIVGICAKCHGDPAFQERHDLDAVVTSYQETFHGKAVHFGSEEAPDCIDCHVVSGESVHFIEGRESPTSAIAEGNVATTCRTAECHADAGENIAGFQVHVTYDKEKYPLQHYMLKFFTALMAGVLYFFVVIIFLELLRRLFPNFSFVKSSGTDEHGH